MPLILRKILAEIQCIDTLGRISNINMQINRSSGSLFKYIYSYSIFDNLNGRAKDDINLYVNMHITLSMYLILIQHRLGEIHTLVYIVVLSSC